MLSFQQRKKPDLLNNEASNLQEGALFKNRNSFKSALEKILDDGNITNK